jgi:hypothetical protein
MRFSVLTAVAGLVLASVAAKAESPNAVIPVGPVFAGNINVTSATAACSPYIKKGTAQAAYRPNLNASKTVPAAFGVSQLGGSLFTPSPRGNTVAQLDTPNQAAFQTFITQFATTGLANSKLSLRFSPEPTAATAQTVVSGQITGAFKAAACTFKVSGTMVRIN